MLFRSIFIPSRQTSSQRQSSARSNPPARYCGSEAVPFLECPSPPPSQAETQDSLSFALSLPSFIHFKTNLTILHQPYYKGPSPSLPDDYGMFIAFMPASRRREAPRHLNVAGNPSGITTVPRTMPPPSNSRLDETMPRGVGIDAS